MKLSDGIEKQVRRLLDHTELTYTEIAEAVKLNRRDVERYARRHFDDEMSLSDDELACSNITEGFKNYLNRKDRR